MNITDEKKIEIRLKSLELAIGRATLTSDVIGTAEEYYQYLMGEQPKSDIQKFEEYLSREPKEISKGDIPEESQSDNNFDSNLLTRMSDLGIYTRSVNYLERNKIIYVGDLVQKTEDEILGMYGLGYKLISDLKSILKEMGLTFGMNVPDWTPENIKRLKKMMKK